MIYQLQRLNLDSLDLSQGIAGLFAHLAGNKHLKTALLAGLCSLQQMKQPLNTLIPRT
jgi:hypothetical protein